MADVGRTTRDPGAGSRHQTTREKLLDRAEQLFAQYGIQAVSPRRIALAAGQRNESAIRYHFGTKEELMLALHTARMIPINQRRRAMLAKMERTGLIDDLRELTTAFIIPIAETIDETNPASGGYVCFLSHLFDERRMRDRQLARAKDAAPLRRVYRLMRNQVPELSDMLWKERLRTMASAAVQAMADRARQVAAREPGWNEMSAAVFASQLVDSCVAMLRAPVSAATRNAIARGMRLVEQEEHDDERRTANG
jgi:AcrR family transcriptional regulator